MSSWRPDHAAQVLSARDVLRGPLGATATATDTATAGDANADPAGLLYQHWYAARPPQVSSVRPWDPPVASAARAGHSSASTWSAEESTVVATGIAGVVVVATRHGRRALCRGEYVTVTGRPGFPPRVGDTVRALLRVGAVVQGGWWRTWGDGWDLKNPEGPLDRVYLRPAPGAVAGLVHAVTGVLAQSDSWMLKVAPTVDGLARPDAAVAYLGGPEREQLRAAVVATVGGLTHGSPPPLTERLGDGVGWAQDPGTGESFGEVRCAAIATAYTALAGDDVSDEGWLMSVEDEFRSRGIDPAAPHRAAATAGVLR